MKQKAISRAEEVQQMIDQLQEDVIEIEATKRIELKEFDKFMSIVKNLSEWYQK